MTLNENDMNQLNEVQHILQEFYLLGSRENYVQTPTFPANGKNGQAHDGQDNGLNGVFV